MIKFPENGEFDLIWSSQQAHEIAESVIRTTHQEKATLSNNSAAFDKEF